jgi:DUF1707 SHOCT-like domain
MAGPGDDIAATGGQGGGDLRASHADRERVIGTVKVAFVQGRLTKDEFDARVGQVYTSRTYAEPAEVTVDIPVERTGARPPRDRWRRRRSPGESYTHWSCQASLPLLPTPARRLPQGSAVR